MNTSDLRLFLNEQIIKIKQLEETGNTTEANTLAENVAHMSSKLTFDGVVLNPLTNEKYYLASSPEKLKGGVKGYASECSNFRKENLYQKDREYVFAELDYLLNKRDSVGNYFIGGLTAMFTLYMNYPAITGIFIQNCTKTHVLQYCNSGSEEGYFFTGQVYDSFQGANNTIQPGYTAGFIHTKTFNSVYGAVGNSKKHS
jgi:hypothetical protein